MTFTISLPDWIVWIPVVWPLIGIAFYIPGFAWSNRYVSGKERGMFRGISVKGVIKGLLIISIFWPLTLGDLLMQEYRHQKRNYRRWRVSHSE
jgi:hypothetical protein